MFKHIILILTVVLFALNVHSQTEKAKIIGYSMDSLTHEFIRYGNAILYELVDSQLIELETFQTGRNGMFEFYVEPGKEYKVLGNAPEYLAEIIPVSKPGAGEEVFLEIPLRLKDIIGWGGTLALLDPLKRAKLLYSFRDFISGELITNVSWALYIQIALEESEYMYLRRGSISSGVHGCRSRLSI